MVCASVTISVEPERRADVLLALRAQLGPMRTQSGCLECSIYADEEDPLRLCLTEEWSDEDHLQRRLRSREYRDLLQIMEQSRVPPRVRFDCVTQRRGMEAIHCARGE